MSTGAYLTRQTNSRYPACQLTYSNTFQGHSPFVLPAEINGAMFVVDATILGTLTRFIRRSCKPTAVSKAVFVDGQIHVGMYQDTITL